MSGTYTFGHSTSAAERLRILADVYEAESAAFLAAHAPPEPRLAIDLGCGPGYTTSLVARTSRAARTVGLDISSEFIEEAQRQHGGVASFLVHDVTAPPFPGGAPDLLFARLLTTHLPEPGAAVARWADALAPGGRLLLDEVDSIDVADPTCRRYLEMTAAVVATTGGALYIGPGLAAMAPAGMNVLFDEAIPYAVSACDAARMFRLNLPNWAEVALASDITTANELETIAAALDGLAEGRVDAPPLTWHMRHVVVGRPWR